MSTAVRTSSTVAAHTTDTHTDTHTQTHHSVSFRVFSVLFSGVASLTPHCRQSVGVVEEGAFLWGWGEATKQQRVKSQQSPGCALELRCLTAFRRSFPRFFPHTLLREERFLTWRSQRASNTAAWALAAAPCCPLSAIALDQRLCLSGAVSGGVFGCSVQLRVPR